MSTDAKGGFTEPTYEGIPLSNLRIDSIEWSAEAAEHIRTRTRRYPDRKEFDLEPEWATEAALDPKRLVALTSTSSIEVIGYSSSAPPRETGESGRVLTVWIAPIDLSAGTWTGRTACQGNERDRKIYKERAND